MSERNNHQGKRQSQGQTHSLGQYWKQYRSWLAGQSKGQRIRYRITQVAVVLSILIIAGYLALSAWIRVPDLNEKPPKLPDSSGAQSFDGAQTPDILRGGRRDGVYTFLLAGRDVVSGSTDTMLLITYDTKAKTIHGLNLPRDTVVNVSTSSKRLNAVYTYNRGKDKAAQAEKGMTALQAQVAKLTGITPDFYILVEWAAIGRLVDALGGVEFDVPFDMVYDDPYQNLHINQKAGLRVLDGTDAMEVIRFRKNNSKSVQLGDVGRLEIQQDFLKAVVAKCLRPATFLKIPELAEIFAENVATDLTVGNILAFAQLAYGMDAENGVTFATAPLGGSFYYRGAAMVSLDAAALLEVLNATMNPYHEPILKSDLEIIYRNKNGSFGVTSGVLADERMGQVPTPPKPEPVPEPVIPPQQGNEVPSTDPVPTNPSGGSSSAGQDGTSQGAAPSGDGTTDSTAQAPPAGGTTTGGDTAPPSGDTAIPEGETQGGGMGSIDPDLVLPDPNSINSKTQKADEAPEHPTTPMLPAWPQGTQEAA